MAANTKYQPAPRGNSFEEGNYTEAPPSYQAESSLSSHGLPGAPRQEDDHIPDDFKVLSSRTCWSSLLALLTSVANIIVQFGGSVAEATLPIRMQFIRKVYAIL